MRLEQLEADHIKQYVMTRKAELRHQSDGSIYVTGLREAPTGHVAQRWFRCFISSGCYCYA